MNSYPEPRTEAEPELAPVVYEQPLNERMRTFLRLEFLYTQATYHSELENAWSSRAAVSSLLEILAITARGDSPQRGAEGTRAARQRAQGVPDQDRRRPEPAEIFDVESHQVARGSVHRRRQLHGAACAIRNSCAPSSIAARFPAAPATSICPTTPTGSIVRRRCAPPSSARWLALIRPLCDSIAELLWLTRQNAKRKSETAVGGIFQLQFDRENPCQLVRVTMPAARATCFPRSAAASIAAPSDSCTGPMPRAGRCMWKRTCRSCSPAAPDRRRWRPR